MQTFPASIPLAGRCILVCGAGLMAHAKLRLFAGSPARIVWYGGDGPDGPVPDDLAGIEPRSGWPAAPVLREADLVFIAGGDPGRVDRLARRARRCGAWVNVVDAPARSDFQTPAIIDRGSVVVSVSTGGAAPVLAVDLRAQIEALLPSRIGILADLARALRAAVRKTLPGIEARRRFWEGALCGPARDLALSGDEAGARRALTRALNATPEDACGRVFLVGAGPGNPDLLTLRAARLLREADVVVHDRLVGPGVLALARRDALRIDVGKSKGHHPVPQEEIGEILIREARKGQRVVRLKGGDPFIFGRGGEELDALHAAGIATEVVPGISAAVACAASAGIPLTHRDEASTVSFVPGVVKPGSAEPDYHAFAAPDQMTVFYMGVGASARLAERLLQAGRLPDTPVAIVEHGSHDNERVVAGTLGELGNLVRRVGIAGPAIIFVGEPARRAVDRSQSSGMDRLAQAGPG